MTRSLFTFAAGLFAAMSPQWLTIPAYAHHSEAPFYDQARTVDIRGVVKSWVFRNPHPFLYVDVTDDKGVTNEWVLEFVGTVRLMKTGWSAKTFVPGEVISASGHPSRAVGTYGLSAAQVSRADGTVILGSGRRGDLAPEAVAGRGGN